MAQTRSADNATRVRARAVTQVETILTLIGGVWLILGLFIDGYAHAEIIDTDTEDFFTPWHAIFYSGFAFNVAVVASIARARATTAPVRTWFPPGYGLAAIGICVFAVGGIGDGIWHTIFGVENSLDALLSPTHLLMLVGMTAVLTAPLRAAWHEPSQHRGWADLLAPVASVAITTGMVAFFVEYTLVISDPWPAAQVYDPVTDSGDVWVAFGLGGAYVATVVLLVPVLLLLRRWDLPRGAVVVLWTVPIGLESLAFEQSAVGVEAAVIGGVAFEAVARITRSSLGRQRAVVAAAGAGTVALWSSWFALLKVSDDLAWQAELWTGQIVMCALLAVILGVLAFPPPIPADPALDPSVRQ